MTTDHKRLVAEARMFAEARGDRRDTTIVNRLADALEAATVERAVVEAQALEQAANARDELESDPDYWMRLAAHYVPGKNMTSIWLRARAVEIREGRQ